MITGGLKAPGDTNHKVELLGFSAETLLQCYLSVHTCRYFRKDIFYAVVTALLLVTVVQCSLKDYGNQVIIYLAREEKSTPLGPDQMVKFFLLAEMNPEKQQNLLILISLGQLMRRALHYHMITT